MNGIFDAWTAINSLLQTEVGRQQLTDSLVPSLRRRLAKKGEKELKSKLWETVSEAVDKIGAERAGVLCTVMYEALGRIQSKKPRLSAKDFIMLRGMKVGL